MHITIATMGTRGDVQPYVALGKGLQRAGHTVRLATFANFASFVRHHGLDFAAIAGDSMALMEAIIHAGTNPLAFMRRSYQFYRPIMDQVLEDTRRACLGADLVVCQLACIYTYHLAEKLGIPCVQAFVMPFHRTRTFPSMMSPPGWSLGGLYNFLTHVVSEQAFLHAFGSDLNRWRQSLGLSPLPRHHWPYQCLHGRLIPVLYGFSPSLIPRPPDWGHHIQVTGHWFLDDDPSWQPPTSLCDFLAAGPPPVYVGFGSITGKDFGSLSAMVLEALRKTGQRGVLLSGWGGLTSSDGNDDVLVLDGAPFGWLFPQMAAVVHHGGIGTTTAGLRAGVPSVIVPFAFDQPFWGQRVHALGVGPHPILHRELTVSRLAAAIRQATSDPAMRERADHLGQRIRSEDGTARAVEVIEQHACSR
ncbi:MAG: glycosyltransferase family 1 protein [Chloroflexaceae bacterium]|nr:glycosyltransferase family 1 protein [Chloroflexaceae bacterium]